MIYIKIFMGILASAMVLASPLQSQAAESSSDSEQEFLFYENDFVTNGEEFLTAATTPTDEILDKGTISQTSIRWTLYTDGRLIIQGSGYIPNSITGDWNKYKTQIISLDIQDGITSIGNQAFANCTKLQKVTLPSGLSTIGQSVFQNCTALKQIDLPAGMDNIGYNTFNGCTSLTNIKLPEKMLELSNNLFYNCTNLTSVTLPRVVNKVGNYCFYGCTNLNNITFQNRVQTIGKYAFYKCSSLTSLILPEPTTRTITSIDQYAFAYCTGLTSFRIPNITNSFGDDVFYGCTNLKRLEIGAKVSNIGASTLRGVPLEEIYFEGSEEAWGRLKLSPMFYNNATVYYDYDPNHPQHTYGPWTTVSNATVFSPEQQVRTCSICQKQEYRSNGSALTPTVSLSTDKLLLKTSQATTLLKAYGLANGDSVRTWRSSNTKIVRATAKADGVCLVKAGTQTGKARITLSLASGLTKVINVTVQSLPVKTTRITGIPGQITLKVKGVQTLHPVITPLTSTDRLIYSSSNSKVAQVNIRGRILALKKGSTVITVQSGRQTIKCKVLVK